MTKIEMDYVQFIKFLDASVDACRKMSELNDSTYKRGKNTKSALKELQTQLRNNYMPILQSDYPPIRGDTDVNTLNTYFESEKKGNPLFCSKIIIDQNADGTVGISINYVDQKEGILLVKGKHR